MRLVDRLTRGIIGPYPGAGLSDASMIVQSYLSNGWSDGKSGERVASDFRSYATLGYAGNGPVFSVLNARLRLFTEATFKFRTLTDKRLFGNSALSLLENPWPNGSSAELLARMIQDADLAGNSFTRRVGPDRLERMRPDWTSIVSEEFEDANGDEYCEVVGYLYWEGGIGLGDDPDFYPVEDVVHWSPIPDPLAKWRGMSWLTPVVREINADLAMVTHKQKFFDQAATPNLLVKYKEQIGTERLTTLREMLDARHAGAANSHRTMVIDNGADVTVVGNNFAEMAFTALQSAGEARIASAGGVPPIVAGLQSGLDASTAVASVAALYRYFADGTMHGLWRGACQALGKFVTVPAGAQLWFDTRDIPALRDAEFERQKANAQMSIAVMNLVNSGYEPGSVVSAVVSGDMSILKHTGLVSVQLLKPNTQLSSGDGQGKPMDPMMTDGGPNAA